MTLWTVPKAIVTVEEFKRLPLEGRRWELLDGRVVQMEPHGLETSAVTASILAHIGNHARNLDLGVVLDAGCGFRCWPGHETVRVTDGSFTRYEGLPADRDRRDFPQWAPDLIVEVFSPFERPVTMLGRIAMFLQSGTQMVWIVDPDSRTVSRFSQRSALPTIGGNAMLDGGDILPGFRVPVAEIFS